MPFLLLNVLPGSLALLSLVLLLWQWLVALRFPLHQRKPSAFSPPVTLLKPLKGCDLTTRDCLRSWFTQQYSGPVQLLLGVASADDPVCEIVRALLRDFPALDAQLVVCGPLRGSNLKVSKLVELASLAKHDVLVVSDADVYAPSDFLANSIGPLESPEVGLVNCFYTLANPTTWAMRWEAVAVNADFWSQVLQAQSLKPLDFALGAVMAARRKQLDQIGGFAALQNCLADDYQLGHRIAANGHHIALATPVVECRSAPMGWTDVWKHQLRWARTIRVCQPAPYFFSILSNPTLWPLLWAALHPMWFTAAFLLGSALLRMATALHLQRRLTQTPVGISGAFLAPVKDLLQAAIWLLAFAGNRIEWRGEQMRLQKDGTLARP